MKTVENFKLYSCDESNGSSENWKKGMDYIKSGAIVETSEKVFWWFLECLPPIAQNGGGFLNSEPYRHNSEGKGVYYCGWEDRGTFYGCHATVNQFYSREPLTRNSKQ